MSPLLALYLAGGVLAAIPWLYALGDSYSTLRNAPTQDRVERLLLLSSCIFDWFGVGLVALFLVLGASSYERWHALAVVFIAAPYVLALYGALKLAFRRQIRRAIMASYRNGEGTDG